MGAPTKATIWVELEIEVTGTFRPAIPESGPSYASGGEPAEPADFEDIEITAIRHHAYRRSPDGAWGEAPFDLLRDTFRAPWPLRKVLDNIAGEFSDEIRNALLEEAAQ